MASASTSKRKSVSFNSDTFGPTTGESSLSHTSNDISKLAALPPAAPPTAKKVASSSLSAAPPQAPSVHDTAAHGPIASADAASSRASRGSSSTKPKPDVRNGSKEFAKDSLSEFVLALMEFKSDDYVPEDMVDTLHPHLSKVRLYVALSVYSKSFC